MKAFTTLFLSICVIGIGISCTSTAKKQPEPEPTLIEVSAIYDAETDKHLFQTDVDTIPSGWTTFRFTNSSPMLHFLFLDHLPGDRTSEELLSEVSPVFQEASYLVTDGKVDEAMAKFAELPEWSNDIVYRGGPGFISPGKSTEVTLYLEPGNYVMECYIKTPDGTYHWNLGMYKDLRVTNDTTKAKAPETPTIEITTTNEGLDVEGDMVPGKHVVAVHFDEAEPGLLAKDVHIVRLEEDEMLDEVVSWLDFNRAEGLVSTAENPGPATFIGGVHEMPRGNTAYFTVDLEPGRYAWISEQPVSGAAYKEFKIPGQAGTN